MATPTPHFLDQHVYPDTKPFVNKLSETEEFIRSKSPVRAEALMAGKYEKSKRIYENNPENGIDKRKLVDPTMVMNAIDSNYNRQMSLLDDLIIHAQLEERKLNPNDPDGTNAKTRKELQDIIDECNEEKRKLLTAYRDFFKTDLAKQLGKSPKELSEEIIGTGIDRETNPGSVMISAGLNKSGKNLNGTFTHRAKVGAHGLPVTIQIHHTQNNSSSSMRLKGGDYPHPHTWGQVEAFTDLYAAKYDPSQGQPEIANFDLERYRREKKSWTSREASDYKNERGEMEYSAAYMFGERVIGEAIASMFTRSLTYSQKMEKILTDIYIKTGVEPKQFKELPADVQLNAQRGRKVYQDKEMERSQRLENVMQSKAAVEGALKAVDDTLEVAPRATGPSAAAPAASIKSAAAPVTPKSTTAGEPTTVPDPSSSSSRSTPGMGNSRS